MSRQGSGLVIHSGADGGLFMRFVDALGIAGVYGVLLFIYDPYFRHVDAIAILLAIVLFEFTAHGFGVYHGARGLPLLIEAGRVWGAWAVTSAMLLGIAFITKASQSFSRVITVGWFVSTPFVLSVFRFVIRQVFGWLRRKGKYQKKVGIAGVTDIGIHLSHRILATPELGMHLVGFYDDRNAERLPALPPSFQELAGNFQDLVEHARQGKVEMIYIALPLRAEQRIAELVEALSDTTATVYFAPDFRTFDLLHGRWSMLGDVPVISIFETPFYGVDGVVKRIEDLVLGTLALIIAAPIMIITAIAIKLTSKGPVFFKQKRYGLNGEVIEILKFRSMYVQEDGPVVKQATKDDPRITPVGRFIRRTSIDELPQLFHVLSGKMSLVGPRPHAVAHNEEYRKQIRRYMLRHKVKPGITGWAQVNGWRGETDTLEKMEKRIEYDLEYIRKWSIFLDIWILFLTIFGRKVRQNAY
ncbi:MAG: undecaprenyl-phosphate glucose phosphotransferase [Deltaproteobacteria bacterium]|nr:undecaprenyl-phosphate glucose phosphotransferase [Deltaproteobacteria bacterium]